MAKMGSVPELEALLRGLVSRRGVRHAVIALASGDGALRWSGAAGEARPDGTPMRPDTPFFVASIDKLFTASVILKLAERGRIGLDEPISTYLPHALINGLHRLRGIERTGAITVRHLLGHTSGLADWLEDRPKGGASLAEHLMREGDLALGLEAALSRVRDRLTPHFPPQPAAAKRQRVRYSDTNYLLLIAIIETATGRALHEVHEAMLFRPLGLRQTWLAGSAPLEPAPEPATLWAGDTPLEIPLMMRTFRGMYSTAEDLLRFLRALVRGELFDYPGTLASMQQRWNRFGLPLDRAALRAPSWPIEYGLGIMRFHDPLFALLRRLPAVIGHTGSTGSWLFHCPELDLFLAGTVDQAHAGAVPFRLLPKILKGKDWGDGPHSLFNGDGPHFSHSHLKTEEARKSFAGTSSPQAA
jgi:D-alanyl-D-alanine carboxypeptidase